MKKTFLLISGMILALLFSNDVYANETSDERFLEVSLRAEKSVVTIGDPIPLEITINNDSTEDVGVIEKFESEWFMGNPGEIILNSALIFMKDVRGFKISTPPYVRIRATHNGKYFQIPTIRRIWLGAPYTVQLIRIEGKELVNLKNIQGGNLGFEGYPVAEKESFNYVRNLVEGEYRVSVIFGVFKIDDLEEMEKGFPYILNPEDPNIFQWNRNTYRKQKDFIQSRMQVVHIKLEPIRETLFPR